VRHYRLTGFLEGLSHRKRSQLLLSSENRPRSTCHVGAMITVTDCPIQRTQSSLLAQQSGTGFLHACPKQAVFVG
jgi:hypothetical protein